MRWVYKAATVGSSNLTEAGLARQFEANARFERNTDGQRYADLVRIAENYWTMGAAFQAALIALLKKLLKPATWEEALARACAELLEGEWAEVYLLRSARQACVAQRSTSWWLSRIMLHFLHGLIITLLIAGDLVVPHAQQSVRRN